MLILTVKYKSALSYDQILIVVEERISEFRALPGLMQKYDGYEQESNAYADIYIWDSEEVLDAYQTSDLAQSIAAAYQTSEPPRIENFNQVETLRPLEPVAPVS